MKEEIREVIKKLHDEINRKGCLQVMPSEAVYDGRVLSIHRDYIVYRVKREFRENWKVAKAFGHWFNAYRDFKFDTIVLEINAEPTWDGSTILYGVFIFPKYPH